MGLEKVQDTAQLAVGYTGALTLMTVPQWIETLTPYCQFCALVVGIAVCVTTVVLNLLSIKKKTKDN